MRHAYEKALEIAAELMAAQISSQPYGSNITQAEEIGKYFLKIVETIHNGIKNGPDD